MDKFYKAVRVNPFGKLVSAYFHYMPPNLIVEYMPGVITRPHTGKLFACKSLFGASGHGEQIWECEVENPKDIRSVLSITYLSDMGTVDGFWKGYTFDTEVPRIRCGDDAVACDSIKLVRRVR